MLLIGSRRIKELFPDFPRDPKDWDYAVKDKTGKSVKDNKNSNSL